MKKVSILLIVAMALVALFVSCTLDPVKEQAFTYITFKSDAPFTVTPSYEDGKAVWNGTLQYSTNLYNTRSWKVFNPKHSTNAKASRGDGGYVLYLRGVDNTVVSAYGNGWTIQASGDVTCTGNIMSLLNCLNVDSATMGTDCFASMFDGWTHLVSSPSIPSDNLSAGCYRGMFKGCSSLCIEEVPEGGDPKNWWVEKIIKVTTADQASSMADMFVDCSSSSIIAGNDVAVGNTYCWFYAEEPDEKPYLTLSCDDYFSFEFNASYWGGTLQYSSDIFNDGWTTIIKDQNDTFCADYNETLGKYVVYLRGKNDKVCNAYQMDPTFDVLQDDVLIDCDGNIMTVLDYENPDGVRMYDQNALAGFFYGFKQLRSAPELPATILGSYCYNGMFSGCTSLVEAPELPATVLADLCYFAMFSGCTSLVEAPELPATTLADWCYDSMFSGCTSLVTAPELPATVLDELCYFQMFQGCTSLVEAPDLPATTLAKWCYQSMFENCTSLEVAPSLNATELTESCYCCMFRYCTSLLAAPNLPATKLASGCYLSMFTGCQSLTVPESFSLPATEFVQNCYYGMFSGCSNLKIEAVATGASPTKPNAHFLFVAPSNVTDLFSGTFYGVSSDSVPNGSTYSLIAGYSYYWF